MLPLENLKNLLWLTCQITKSEGGWIGVHQNQKWSLLVRIGNESESIIPYPQKQPIEIFTQGPPIASLKKKYPHYFQAQITSQQNLSVLICCFGTQPYQLEQSSIIESLCRQAAAILDSEHMHANTLAQLASGITHEINNPLSIISGNLEMIKSITNDQAITGSIQKIEKTILRIQKIIAGLKTLAQKSTIENSLQKTSIQSIIDEALPYFQQKLLDNKVALTFHSPKTPIWIHCNPVQISQVILNLIHNAADALENTNNGKINLEINTDSQYVELKVIDNGPGIPEETLKRIFTPFFTTKGAKGTGLGLSISKGIIEAHHGTLTAKNNIPEVGATFVVKLPIKLD